ncbi:MAG: hypothetical protein U1E62_05240 [Alsobacter sp.]
MLKPKARPNIVLRVLRVLALLSIGVLLAAWDAAHWDAAHWIATGMAVVGALWLLGSAG